MIPIGRINQAQAAQRFCQYLAQQGIAADWLPEGRMCVIRVASSAHVAQAKQELHGFLREPLAARYNAPASGSAHASDATKKAQAPASAPYEYTPVTLVLVCLSLSATLASVFGRNIVIAQWLWFDPAAIAQGQWQRLLTPLLLHYSLLSLLLQGGLFWLLGRYNERRYGSLYHALALLLLIMPASLLQYYFLPTTVSVLALINVALFSLAWLRQKHWRGLRLAALLLALAALLSLFEPRWQTLNGWALISGALLGAALYALRQLFPERVNGA